MTAPIRIEAESDSCEHFAVLASAQPLTQALNAATGADWPIQGGLRVINTLASRRLAAG
jgi:hypothetical protein